MTRGVDEAHKRQDETWRRELVEIEHEIQQKQNEELELSKTLSEWKNKKDPEPKRHPETVSARLALEEQKIPFVPLYEAVEFHKNVSPIERERIEGVLNDIGLLDTLVVPQEMVVALCCPCNIACIGVALFMEELTHEKNTLEQERQRVL